MKILMILDREFPPDLRVENEIEALSGAGHEIHLACYTRKNRSSFEKTDKYYLHRKIISNIAYKSSVGALIIPIYFNFWRSFLEELITEYNFDAIHVHDLPLARVAAEFSKKQAIPLTIDLHENWPAYLRIATHTKSLAGQLLSPNKKWVKYEREVLDSADNIIVVVDEAAERLEGLGLDRTRIHVVSNTLNMDHFSRSEKKTRDGKLILFYAGGLNYHRGLQIVIRAMSVIKEVHPEIIFWILGEGSFRSALENLAVELGVEKQVIFKGWQPYGEMTRLMMESDYTLIPHLRSDHTDSTIPHKLFQYMYAGKPVIASDCKPIARIVNDTKSGYIYTSDRPEELANILTSLKDEDPKIAGSNGIKWVEKKYNWSQDSSVLVDIYGNKK